MLYSIYDSVAQTFYAPSLFKNDSVAKRNFGELMSADRFAKTRGDFVLYRVGSFDESKGAIKPEKTLVIVAKGGDFENADNT